MYSPTKEANTMETHLITRHRRLKVLLGGLFIGLFIISLI